MAEKNQGGLNTVVVHYYVKAGKEKDFEQLLRKHWPTLRDLGLVEKKTSEIYRGQIVENRKLQPGTLYIEIFTWLPGGAEKAHELPEVMAIWEPMGPLCTRMEFPHVDHLPEFLK